MFKAKSKCLETEGCTNNDTISEAFANVLWKTEKVSQLRINITVVFTFQTVIFDTKIEIT